MSPSNAHHGQFTPSNKELTPIPDAVSTFALRVDNVRCTSLAMKHYAIVRVTAS